MGKDKKSDSGDWICTDVDCKNVNYARRTRCNRCGKDQEVGQSKQKYGVEIGKAAADKSRGLFSAEDWQCSKCANVNWARRQTCNMCNAPKFTEVEERTGYGGGYNDRGVVEYKDREESDGEYDEFGRRKKKKSDEPDTDRRKRDNKKDDDEDDDDDEGDLSKYDLWGSDDEAATKKPKDKKSRSRSRSRSTSSSSSRNSSSTSSSSSSASSSSSSGSSSSRSRSNSRNSKSPERRSRTNRKMSSSHNRSKSPSQSRGKRQQTEQRQKTRSRSRSPYTKRH